MEAALAVLGRHVRLHALVGAAPGQHQAPVSGQYQAVPYLYLQSSQYLYTRSAWKALLFLPGKKEEQSKHQNSVFRFRLIKTYLVRISEYASA